MKESYYSKHSRGSRIVHRNGKMARVKRRGVKKFLRSELYINTLRSSWWYLIFTIVSIYILVNSVFAGLYLIEDGAIENMRPGSFADAFYFSVQTLATIGYGKMSPVTNFAHFLVAVEALIGLFSLAIVAGVIFSKVSMPSARILFGDNAIIAPYKKTPCFLFRLGNLRNSQIADPTVKVVLVIDEEIPDGSIKRAFYDLKLPRNNSPILMPSWTLHHKISKSSPLFGLTREDMKEKNIEIIVSLVGFDETLSQTVHTHHSYVTEEIKFSGSFADIIIWDKKGNAHVNYKRFHDIV